MRSDLVHCLLYASPGDLGGTLSSRGGVRGLDRRSELTTIFIPVSGFLREKTMPCTYVFSKGFLHCGFNLEGF